MVSRNTRHQRNQTRLQKRRLLHSFYHWHRSIGLLAAFFAVWLALTGIALNHSPRFGLDTRLVESQWLLHWYGIDLSQSHASEYNHQGNTAWSFQNSAIINNQAIQLNQRVNSLSANDGFWLIATSSSLSLATLGGELIETTKSIPNPITVAQLVNNGNILLLAQNQTFCGDISFSEWSRCAGTAAVNKTSRPLTPSDAATANAHSISWERVIQDAHSGRLFGLWGTAIADICGLLIVLLAFTGTYTWYSRRRRRKHKQR